MTYKKIETVCGICPGECQVEIETDGRNIKSIKKSSINSPASVCLRGMYSDEIVNSKDRILNPLIRTAPKGEIGFREASWDEAIEYMRDKFTSIIDNYGAHSIMSHIGRGGFDSPTDDIVSARSGYLEPTGFLSPIGSPNNASVASLCYVSFGVFAPMTTFGIIGKRLLPDIENTDYLVVWGTNPKMNSPMFRYNNIVKQKKCGMKLIVIDHYKSDIAKLADKFIMIKSGSDGAFIHGIVKYLKDNDMLDIKYLKNYCHGLDAYLNYVDEFNIKRVIEETGIGKDEIVYLAKLLLENTAALLSYTGLEYTNCGVQTIRALYTLWMLTKNIDIKGGLLINDTQNERAKHLSYKKSEYKGIGSEEFPLFTKLVGQAQMTQFPKSVLEGKPYKIRGLINIGSVISINYPQSNLYREALKNLDFFVTADRFLTNDAEFADVILPATTYYEEDSYVIYLTHIILKPHAIEPRGNAKPNYVILHNIAEALGFGDEIPKNQEELIEHAFYHMPEVVRSLKENGIYYFEKNERHYLKYETGELREDGKPGFPTPSGRFEIYSNILNDYGYEPLPEYIHGNESSKNTPDLFLKYPLIMNTGARIASTFRTQHLNIEGLLNHQPYPLIILNSCDAKRRGIKDGDWVRVFNARGEIKMVARVIDEINEGDTEINIGGGNKLFDINWRDANVNLLTDNTNQDQISGFPIFKQLLCEVEKI
ncbi:MAG: molybdopterin-dependent oxidoreductase [Ezakiella sp.]|nr:molybdopterin-dependent oxidoreductase [Ezakiella sp.]